MSSEVKDQTRTECKIQDARKHLAELAEDAAEAEGARAHAEALEELLNWFGQAAEERDRLKAEQVCSGCSRAISRGTGIEKGGKLRPLCPSCQQRSIAGVQS